MTVIESLISATIIMALISTIVIYIWKCITIAIDETTTRK